MGEARYFLRLGDMSGASPRRVLGVDAATTWPAPGGATTRSAAP